MIPFSTRAERSSFASLMTLARLVASASAARARWAVGVAPWNPTLAVVFAPTLISQEYAPAWRFTAPSVIPDWMPDGSAR